MNKAKVRNLVQGPVGVAGAVAIALALVVPTSSAVVSEVSTDNTVSASRTYDITSAVDEAAADAQQQAEEEAARKAAEEEAARQAAEEQAAAEAAAASSSRVYPINSYSMTAYFGQAGSYWSSGYHTGQDFAASTGTPVYAAHSGTVVEAGWGGAYGNVIVIEGDDGYKTRYAHNNTMNVSVGQHVSAGQQIATVGATGNVTGAHLHFEVMNSSGSFIDPIAWLNG